MTLSIYDQYWVVLNHNPATQVYKSAAFGFVANNVASFQTWLNGGDFGSRYAILDAQSGAGGKVRLTLTTTTNLVTGMTFLVRGVLGTTEANGFWGINVIDATHVDLAGTVFVNAFIPYPDPTLTGIGLSADMVGATIIDTFDNLYASLDVNAHRYWDGLNTSRVQVIDVGPGNVALSNPPPQFIIVTNTTATAGRKVLLPRFDTPKSMPIGQEIVFLAFALNSVTVAVRDYTDSFEFFNMTGGEVWGITSQGNTIDTGFANSRITRNPYIGTARFFGAHKIAGNDSASGDQPAQELDVSNGLEFTGAGGIRRSALTGYATAAAGSNTTTVVKVLGVNDASDAAAGDVGEYFECNNPGTSATVTISNASPAVVTDASHNMSIGQIINFTTTGALPTGLSVGTNYYVSAHNYSSGSYEVTAGINDALDGTNSINTSSAGSGVHTRANTGLMTTVVNLDIAGLKLTAGDWDFGGAIRYAFAGTTTVNNLQGWISNANATTPSFVGDIGIMGFNGIVPVNASGIWIPNRRFTVNATTKFYLTARSNFGTSTENATGKIWARRRR